MRFDTRDKKPKLYFLIPITVAALIVFMIAHNSPEKNSVFLCVLVIAYLSAAVSSLIWAFFAQLRYNPYSYNTIYYVGFALFIFSVLVTHCCFLYKLFRFPDAYSANEIPVMLLNSAKKYMYLSAPFALFFSAALFVSNISLLIHERKRFVNVLGILLAIILVVGEVLLFLFDESSGTNKGDIIRHSLIVNIYAAVYLYFECMIIGTIIANAIVVRYKVDHNRDYLIVLGCGLRKDGTPTPLLQSRIDRAIAFYKEQKSDTGKELVFITSGGKGDTEANSESFAMTRRLIERGIPEEIIIREDDSRDTVQNMLFSKAKIAERSENGVYSNDQKVAYATSNYHVFRSGICARRAKMRAIGIGAKTKWYFWPNAAVREFVGLLVEHRLKQAVILGCILAAYVLLTIAVYG